MDCMRCLQPSSLFTIDAILATERNLTTRSSECDSSTAVATVAVTTTHCLTRAATVWSPSTKVSSVAEAQTRPTETRRQSEPMAVDGMTTVGYSYPACPKPETTTCSLPEPLFSSDLQPTFNNDSATNSSNPSWLRSTKSRSPRIPFSRIQVQTLEAKFRQTAYLSSLEVSQLAKRLNLTETRVKIWFQNRRARERRDAANTSESSPNTREPAIHTLPSSGSANTVDSTESLSAIRRIIEPMIRQVEQTTRPHASEYRFSETWPNNSLNLLAMEHDAIARCFLPKRTHEVTDLYHSQQLNGANGLDRLRDQQITHAQLPPLLFPPNWPICTKIPLSFINQTP